MAKKIILLLIVIVGVWYFFMRDKEAGEPTPQPAGTSQEEVATDRVADEDEETSAATQTGDGDVLAATGKVRVHYFTKAALDACSTETVALVQDIETKYGHPAAGALVAMTLFRADDAPGDYVSALAQGTRLLTLRIDGEGKAAIDFNSRLKEELGKCGGAQRRAQIENTVREFPQVKAVAITVNGKIWEE